MMYILTTAHELRDTVAGIAEDAGILVLPMPLELGPGFPFGGTVLHRNGHVALGDSAYAICEDGSHIPLVPLLASRGFDVREADARTTQREIKRWLSSGHMLPENN